VSTSANTEIDVNLDLFEEIDRLKKDLNAVLLAHYYQDADIQDVADFIGDSLQLAQQARKTSADVIVFAGVHFMAEMAKILNPEKLVLLPDLEAGCSLAEDCPGDRFREYVEAHPDHVVVSYVNCSAAVKALSDILCTSSNAETIINSIPADRPVIFAPDQNLGRYLSKRTGREMLLWPGICMVHDIFSEKKLSSILNFVTQSPNQSFIIATEPGIIHQMEKRCPEKVFIPAPPDSECACNECPHMKLNTLEKLYLCMRDRRPEISLDEEIRRRALVPLERMLEISARAAR
jgi:quinolinate synthase